MSRSAVFSDRHAHRSRITTVTEDEHLLEVFSRALDRAGFEIESVEEGADTPFDLAATFPDLLIIGIAPEIAPATVHALVRELVEHPHLRHVPVRLCAPTELAAVPMDLPEHAAVEVVPRPRADEEVEALVRRWIAGIVREP
jgi:DNA-binding NtrC family response regulator